MIVRGLAPAKLNLYLEVVGKRPDGYHELATLFQTVGWGDDVEVERTASPGVPCTVEGADGLPTDERNLAVRAASAWLDATGAGGGVRILLRKRIPVGGGLGGGSSDAAAVLRLLDFEDAMQRRVASAGTAGGTVRGAAGAGAPSGPPLPREELARISAALGADVPFLLDGGTATGTGRGDVIHREPTAPRVEVVLVMPPFGTETGKVFARCAERLRRAPAGGLARARAALASGDPAAIRAAHHNDLAEAALRAYPELLRFTSRCERALGRPPCLTGSGSTLFDVPDVGEAADVVARLRDLPGRREIVHTLDVLHVRIAGGAPPPPPP